MQTVRDNFHYSMFNEMEDKIKNGNSAGSYLEKVLANQEELGMSREEMVILGNVLMDAGGETTAASLQNMSLAIMTYPEQVKKIQDEIDSVVGHNRLPSIEDLESLPYLKAFIAEVSFPPFPHHDDSYYSHFRPTESVLCSLLDYPISLLKTFPIRTMLFPKAPCLS